MHPLFTRLLFDSLRYFLKILFFHRYNILDQKFVRLTKSYNISMNYGGITVGWKKERY